MGSAISANGSTRRWRKLRAAYSLMLPCTCPRCGELINRGDQWDLGHETDRAYGGTDDRLRPEHRSCSRAAGIRTARKRQKSGPLPPSRDW
jgi:hypothetical protein